MDSSFDLLPGSATYFARRDMEALTLQSNAVSRLQSTVDERTKQRIHVMEQQHEKLRSVEVAYQRNLDDKTRHINGSLQNISAIAPPVIEPRYENDRYQDEQSACTLLSTTIDKISEQFLHSAENLNQELIALQHSLSDEVQSLLEESRASRAGYEAQVDNVCAMLSDVVQKLKEEVKAEGEQRRKAEQLVMARYGKVFF